MSTFLTSFSGYALENNKGIYLLSKELYATSFGKGNTTEHDFDKAH